MQSGEKVFVSKPYDLSRWRKTINVMDCCLANVSVYLWKFVLTEIDRGTAFDSTEGRMDRSEIENKRQQVENVYLKRVRELYVQRTQLDAWKEERIRALELIAGDGWLALPTVGSVPVGVPSVVPSQNVGGQTMADVARSAVSSMKGDFTKKSVEDWIATNRPDMDVDALSGAIRTILWKMKKDKKIIPVGKMGKYSIYRLVESLSSI